MESELHLANYGNSPLSLLTSPQAESVLHSPAEEGQAIKQPRVRRLRIRLIIGVLLAAVAFLLWFFVHRTQPHSVVVTLSGRIEGDDSSVAAKIAGRISTIRVREGDHVNAGDELAQLEDSETRAQYEQAQATAQRAAAQTELSRRESSVLQSELDQNTLLVLQSRTDAEGRVSEAAARLAGAEASLARAEATHKTLKFTAEAYAQLLEKDEVSKQEAIETRGSEEAQAALVSAGKREVEAARGALQTAQATAANPTIRLAQTEVIRRQMLRQQAEIQTSEADAARARAAVAEAEARLADLRILAPFSGAVSARLAEPGEVLSAGAPIVTLIDLKTIYLRAFIPEGLISRVRLGQKAHVFLDSALPKALNAVVIRVDPEASFTPENTYFREDRVKEVLGVKLLIESSDGSAKPGMPADGEILVEGTAWPKVQ
jgi:HlyD family secretion protein